MQCTISKKNSANRTESKIQKQYENEPAETTASCHMVLDNTIARPRWFRFSVDYNGGMCQMWMVRSANQPGARLRRRPGVRQSIAGGLLFRAEIFLRQTHFR